ncbi:ECF RNA polymerase sigma factor SigL [Stieleria neptunia]|uniref:ECF RNA polymerase sigma factor SigL n=1 Tax=Stieleria neptunia TaxID=2527979 RepID=A0A518I3B9_9BACT|nr:RNA polymerase sigma factor [Stieleria neptunia]QDV47602.1 ECF RNA polymerase sigma factor SigL [Stieleria neptunia]
MIQFCLADRTEFMLKQTPEIKQSGAEGECQLPLRALFETEETPLLRYAFSLTGRRAVAEEIVQEVFLQLHSRWDQVETPKAWLFRSVRNRAFSYIRHIKHESLSSDDGKPSSDYSDTGFNETGDETPEEMLLRMEAAGALRQSLEELDEADRQLVRLKYFDDLTYRDISVQTGLTIGNVGYRLHHILKKLAGKLRPLGIDGSS